MGRARSAIAALGAAILLAAVPATAGAHPMSTSAVLLGIGSGKVDDPSELRQEMARSFAQGGKAIFVTKFIGPYTLADD